MGARIVWVAQVKLEGMGTLDVAFAQLPSLPGRQFTHDHPAFTQAQPLHKPGLLHLQHTIVSFTPLHVVRPSVPQSRTPFSFRTEDGNSKSPAGRDGSEGSGGNSREYESCYSGWRSGDGQMTSGERKNDVGTRKSNGD